MRWLGPMHRRGSSTNQEILERTDQNNGDPTHTALRKPVHYDLKTSKESTLRFDGSPKPRLLDHPCRGTSDLYMSQNLDPLYRLEDRLRCEGESDEAFHKNEYPGKEVERKKETYKYTENN